MFNHRYSVVRASGERLYFTAGRKMVLFLVAARNDLVETIAPFVRFHLDLLTLPHFTLNINYKQIRKAYDGGIRLR